MLKPTCLEFRLKLAEIKALKNEFDLELGKLDRGRSREQIRNFKKELEEKIRNLRDEIGKIWTAHGEEEINEYTKKYVGPLFKDIFQKLPKKCEDIRTSLEGEKIERYYVEIGDKGIEQFLTELQLQCINLPQWVEVVLRNNELIGLEKKKIFCLVKLTVSDLGFPDGATKVENYQKSQELGFKLLGVNPQDLNAKDSITVAMLKLYQKANQKLVLQIPL